MSDANDFINHPRTFLRNNILIVKGNAGGTGGVKTFHFAQSGAMNGLNMLLPGSPPMRVFMLLEDGGAGVPVPIHWCPYSDSSALGTTLPGSGGPNTMFTYAMDGCTFVAGSRTATKDVQVHHVNMKSQTGSNLDPAVGIEQQRKIQRNVARGLVTNPELIDPDDYYDPATRRAAVPGGAKISTVTFGRRSSTQGWKFYTHQYYTVPGDRMTLRFIGCERFI